MIEIGQQFKEKREENGVSVEEAASDLKVRPSQIVSLEDGKKEDFSDISYLKEFILDYAKYLGLNGEKLIDQFNEYMFDCTSMISVDAIIKASNNRDLEALDKVSSPYTSVKKKNLLIPFLIFILTFLIVFVVGYLLIQRHLKNEFLENKITYKIGGVYEFSE